MTIYGRLTVPIVVTILLSACGGDEVHDSSPQERMMREAMCVAASERFALYDDAKKHFAHGMDAAADYFRRSGEPAQFLKMINAVRSSLISKQNEFVATLIATQCNGRVTAGQVADF
ncbi:hypothetical protein ALP03_200272 [Pseudomonas amygdali pv. tabaci]|uniref:Lipoprotein n=1 Tax=Pseudomonas amygdali pv. tabaci TaxID=322 RepID=A0A3M6HS70_PSEAJ|nr:hypothetical protein ALP03_200272 [Pseudomonas amygdali pv. tabaci]